MIDPKQSDDSVNNSQSDSLISFRHSDSKRVDGKEELPFNRKKPPTELCEGRGSDLL